MSTTTLRAEPTTRIPCHEPATGRYLGEVAVTPPDEVRRLVAEARDAQQALAKTSFAERRSVLRHILRHVLAHADELVELVVRDAGKTHENAMMGEIWPVAEKLRWTIRHGEKHLRPERVSSGLFVHKKATIEFHPRGVVGVICPWNYPLQNILGPVIPALMAGNACVVKVSEHVAWSAARIGRILDEALDAHGLPRALVQLVHGYGDTGAALVSSGVDLVVFTGSMGNGRKVVAESAKTLVPVILELGGKDPLVVCDDASLEQAAHAALNGAFIAAGQNCLAAERVLVMDGVYDRFVARVAELARGLRQDVPTGRPGAVDVGALVTPAQAEIVDHLVQDAVAKGARALVGGKRPARAGNWFEPTVLVDVRPDMLIAQEEVFGPILSIFRVKDDDDAVRVANSTAYGLGCTVFSKDAARAKRLADRIESGSASINDFGFTYMAQDLPFGGVGGSGYGRLNGREGLRACTNVKAVLEDRLPLHAPAKVYPVGPLDAALFRGVLRTLYGPGLRDRVRGVRDLLSTAMRR
ncbi:MAG: aldehyde dehydrogenase family protein [Myxococcales bacterium]|nr:aldehyde dehydrogenase family protein [Myxococcales bacterium]